MGFDDNVGAHAQLFQLHSFYSRPNILEVVCCANVKAIVQNGKPLGALPFSLEKTPRGFYVSIRLLLSAKSPIPARATTAGYQNSIARPC